MKEFLQPVKRVAVSPIWYGKGLRKYSSKILEEDRQETEQAFDALCELLKEKHQEYAKDLEDIKVALNEQQTVQLDRVLAYVERYRRRP